MGALAAPGHPVPPSQGSGHDLPGPRRPSTHREVRLPLGLSRGLHGEPCCPQGCNPGLDIRNLEEGQIDVTWKSLLNVADQKEQLLRLHRID